MPVDLVSLLPLSKHSSKGPELAFLVALRLLPFWLGLLEAVQLESKV